MNDVEYAPAETSPPRPRPLLIPATLPFAAPHQQPILPSFYYQPTGPARRFFPFCRGVLLILSL